MLVREGTVVDTLRDVATTRAKDDARIGRDARRRCSRWPSSRTSCRRIIRCARFACWSTRRWHGLNGLFNAIYADSGRASIAPEKLLRAMLIQVFFSVRSERQLMEQMRYNLLYRWFIGLAIDDDGLGPLGVLQEPRPAARARRGGALLHRGDATGRQAQLAQQGALLGGRHADPGVGQPQELRAQGRRQRRRQRRRHGRAQRAGRLEGQAAQQRHPRQHDRPGCAAVPQEPQHRRRSWPTRAMC